MPPKAGSWNLAEKALRRSTCSLQLPARDDPRRHVHASCNPRAVHQPMLKQLPAVGVLAAAGKYNWALLMTKNSIRGTQRATCLRRRLSLSRKFFRTRLGHCRASTVCLPRFCALLQLLALCRLRVASSRPAAAFNANGFVR